MAVNRDSGTWWVTIGEDGSRAGKHKALKSPKGQHKGESVSHTLTWGPLSPGGPAGPAFPSAPYKDKAEDQFHVQME